MVLSIVFAVGAMMSGLGAAKRAASLAASANLVGDGIELRMHRRDKSLGIIEKNPPLLIIELDEEMLGEERREFAGRHVLTDREWVALQVFLQHFGEDAEKFGPPIREILGFSEKRKRDGFIGSQIPA